MRQFDSKHLDDLQARGLIRGYNENSIAVKDPQKQSKYKNQKHEIDGITFDSKKEAGRYLELRMLVRIGEITDLELQVSYLLIEANGKERKCEYKSDFRYRIVSTGAIIVEDVKSKATRKLSTYIMKRKLMNEKYGIKIKEV